MTKTQKIMGAVLIGISATVFFPHLLKAQEKTLQIPANVLSQLNAIKEQKLKAVPPPPNLKAYLGAAQTSARNFDVALEKLNNTRGYDPNIYGLIRLADSYNDNIKSDIKALVPVVDVPLDVQTQVANVQAVITLIERLAPEVPATLPGRCKGLQGSYEEVTGFIDKRTGTATGWSLKTSTAREIPIDKNVGLIGQGTLINPSYTPQGFREKAWVDKKINRVVCLSTEKL